MENALDNSESARRFLLGNLSEAERAEIEDGFLAQDDSYQELLIAEDDLIDAYVRGELSAPDRALFERWISTSQRRTERVEFAQTLFDSVSGKAAIVRVRAPTRPLSWWRSLAGAFTQRPALAFTFAVAFLVMVLGGLWLLTYRGRTRPVPQQAHTIQPTPITTSESPIPPAEEQQLARDDQPTPARETPKTKAPVIATFTLLPGLVRGDSGAGALILPAGTTEVRLRLALEDGPYERYRATLSTPEGRKLWSREFTKGHSTKAAHLAVSIPAELLKDGDYVVDLSGANAAGKRESVADYSFRIVRK